MGNRSSNLWTSTYLAIKNKHDKAFNTIEWAVRLEEQEKPYEAMEKYKEGIKVIDELLSIQVECPENPDSTWESACTMIKKIKKTRAVVLSRINCIQSASGFEPGMSDEPPSYEEAISSSDEDSHSPHQITYRDLATALNELSIDPNHHLNEEIVYTHPGVRLYFISPNGDVMSAQEPETLKISLVNGNEPNAPRAILQIGDWVYPLVPGVSPCYRTDYGAFILPNVYSDVPGSSVGIILPSDAESDVFDLLENILHGIVTQETEQEIQAEKRRWTEREDVSTRISNKIVDGAWYVSQGLIKGAESAGNLLNRNTPKLINNISPTDRPAIVPRNLTKSVKIAENATSKAVQVTGFVADKVGTATVRLGKYLAPHIQKQGTKLLTTGFNMSEEEASEKVKGILTVAAGAVEGFSTVYRGLETSAAILGRNLKENTVKVVQHKYGVPAAETTEGTFNTVGNVYYTYQNAKIFKPSGLAKRTAKDTGKAMVQGYTSSSRANMSLREVLEAGPSRVRPIRKQERPESDKENEPKEKEIKNSAGHE